MNWIDEKHLIILISSIAGVLFSRYVLPGLWAMFKLYCVQIWESWRDK